MKQVTLHILIYIGLFYCLVTASCVHTDPENDILQAEAEIEDGNPDAARDILSNMVSSGVAGLSVEQRCRMAMTYIRMAEISDEQDDMATAAAIFMQALEDNPDSAAAYIKNLSVDQQRHASMLIELTRGMSSSDSIPTDEYPDSVHIN